MNTLRANKLQHLKLIVLLYMITIISSCAAPMSNIQQNESFTLNSIKQDHIVFGGLISEIEEWNNEKFEQYSNIARKSLSTISSDISFSPNDNLVINIGYGELINYINLLLESEDENREILITLSNIAKDSRYIIFSKLLSDDIIKNNYSSNAENTYITERKISVFTSIYDLKNLNSVWSGNISTTISNTNTNPHHHDSNFLADLVTTLVEDVIYGNYPEPPSLESLLTKTFSDIGDNVTNRPCSELGYINCIIRSFSRL